MDKCDAHFIYEMYTPKSTEFVPIYCGVTYDYCAEEGQSACLVFAKIAEWDVVSMMDDGLREEIEQFACMNSYEIEQRMTHNSMRKEDEYTR